MDPSSVQRWYEVRLSSTPDLSGALADLVNAHAALAACFRSGHKCLLAGNGGSFADCLHIAGELAKSFEAPRPLTAAQAEALGTGPEADRLRDGIEQGLPAAVLGANGAVLTAVLNDRTDSGLVLAQECMALGRRGDLFWGISTSGEAENVRLAMALAASKGMATVSLTGTPGGALAEAAEIAVRTPGETTAAVQEYHVKVYHALCAGIEADLFDAA